MPYLSASERVRLTAIFADSFMTSPSEPVNSVLPVPSSTSTSSGSIVPPTDVHAEIALNAEEIGDVLIGHIDLLFARNEHFRALAADVGDIALELSYARLAGVAVDDGIQRLVAYFNGGSAFAVLRKLLVDKVALCNVEFFLAGVAA